MVAGISLILFFFDPQFEIERSQTKPKKILVLVDQSTSMRAAWSANWDSVKQVFQNNVQTIAKEGPVEWSVMANQNNAEPESFSDIKFKQTFSPFPDNFPEKYPDQYAAVIVFTDGQFNVGQSALDADWIRHVPVYPVLPVKPRLPAGIRIEDVVLPDFVRAGDSIIGHITWRSLARSPESLILAVDDQTRDINFITRVIKSSGNRENARLAFLPNLPGRHQFKISLRDRSGKFISDRTSSVRVGKKRFRILLVADALTPLVTELQRVYSDTAYQLTNYVSSKRGGFLGGKLTKDIPPADVLVLLDNGNLAINPQTRALIQQVYRDTLPTIVFNENKSELGKMIKGLRGVTLSRSKSFTPLPVASGKSHPLGILATSLTQSGAAADFWTTLPPLLAPERWIRGKGAIILGQVESKNELSPVMQIVTDKPILICNGLGWWRWFLRSPGNTQFSTYWQQITDYLLSIRQLKLVKIHIDRRNPSVGESIPVSLRVQDLDGRSLDDGTPVVTQINLSTGESETLRLNHEGVGDYATKLKTLIRGKFLLTGVVKRFGEVWGSDSVGVRIVPFSAENAVLGVDKSVLERLAAKSSGNMLGPDPLTLNLQQTETYLIWQHFKWPGIRNLTMLLLVILVLAVEWAYRRRMGLM